MENLGGKVEYAFDYISEHNSYQNMCQVLDQKSGHITLILPGKEYGEIPASIKKTMTFVGGAHKDTDMDPWQKMVPEARLGNQEFAHAMFRFLGRGLAEEWFKGMPFEVVSGGLGGVEEGLRRLKNGEVSAKKLVFRIEDTEGVERDRTNQLHVGGFSVVADRKRSANNSIHLVPVKFGRPTDQ